MRTTLFGPLTAALLLVALAMLAGCAAFDTVRLKMDYGWTEERMLAYGWLDARVVPPSPIYCYRTLGEPDCFAEAQPDERSRLIGYYPPAGE